ncbi:hypothetical protein [Borrelia hermsii]|uniref:Uncharacterized protein n=1 Tax=Borrelia hermsii HS1 TaxID=1867252 RepID=A0ABN4NY91_BORHE|nr:hypothetical protein [Borrelia hermsii]ANA44015.1 hypothetical protein AXX13_D02 [Borrelia hermsii HS1]UPA08431.1 hypothetical protein bhDAH_001137 [Borrelia hermsii DAH]UPA08434.1 hypothetical protein bhDAH_001140 [Borrelia hermsii DAH]
MLKQGTSKKNTYSGDVSIESFLREEFICKIRTFFLSIQTQHTNYLANGITLQYDIFSINEFFLLKQVFKLVV